MVVSSVVPRVRGEDLDAVERSAVAALCRALADAVVEDLHASGSHVQADGGWRVDRERLLRIAAVVAVSLGTVTDVEAQLARVEPDSGDTLAVVAAVATVGGDVEDVAPATDSAGRGDDELDGEVEREVDDSEGIAVDDLTGVREHVDHTVGVECVAGAVRYTWPPFSIMNISYIWGAIKPCSFFYFVYTHSLKTNSTSLSC